MTQGNHQENSALKRAFALHPRLWQQNRYVYPVVSRRSKGISIGVNLNPDKVCNFDCIYCCVDRTTPGPAKHVDLAILRQELSAMLQWASSGEIYTQDPFDKIPPALRRINDIAFSGDGEPTACPNFMSACQLAAELAHAAALDAGQHPIKLIVITNATLFHQPRVREALAFLDNHHGEIWAKLDAGTDAYYHLVDRTTISLRRVLDNIKWCCLTRPTVIQSLFMRVHELTPPTPEIDAYAQRLASLLSVGGKIKLVQIYTVARKTAEAYATPLTEPELKGLAARVAVTVPSVPIEVYP